MRVLLDTCVLAEIRHPQGRPEVKRKIAGFHDDSMFLSVLTIGEIHKGVSLLSPGKKRTALLEWLNGLEQNFETRILPVDCEVARLWGDLTARAQSRGVVISAADGLIAATALRHGLTVVTRNLRHFNSTGAAVFDPWVDASSEQGCLE